MSGKTYHVNLNPVILIVTVVLLALKAGGVIDWSLWACTAPLWVPFVAIYGFALLMILFAGLLALLAIIAGK